jgi:sugar lactone lactonase YvrE
MQKTRSLYLAGLALAMCGYAVETKFWQQYEAADYEKATLHDISLRSDGRLTLAPVFREVYDTSTAYLWSVAEDSKGNVYVGGGSAGASTAKLFQVEPNGKGKVLAELEGLEIHAIAVDKENRVYAATSPDGKVYRVGSNGKATVFYDPKAKYIWGMAFDSKGNLFVATGDEGKVHKVGADGKGSVFFQTEDTHARSLAVDGKDNLIVGTEPGGLILRVSPGGEGFVLYQSAKREITAVAVRDGVIYAAGVGSKTPATLPTPSVTPAPKPSPTPSASSSAAARPQPALLPPTLSPSASIAGGSEVYRIDPDGAPHEAWRHSSDIVYAIGFDGHGKVLLGTGNRGRIYRLESDRLYTQVVDSTSTQITGLLGSRKGGVYVVTANIGKLFQLGPELDKEGSVESDVLDAGAFSYWGRARLEGKGLNGAGLETRSGNLDRPQKNWSKWEAVTLSPDTGKSGSPPARFLQYRLKLKALADGSSPEVSLVELAYLTKNVAPAVQEVETTPANYKFPNPVVSTSTTPPTLTLTPLGQRRRSSGGISLDASSNTLNYAKGWMGARWRADDDNGDTLEYKVEIRGVGEKEWKLLKDKLKERNVSWDTTGFADGEYQVRVTASDAPDNPPAQALTSSLESDTFTIDNTPPQITELSATEQGGKILLKFRAKDARSVIEKAEYSVNGGSWIPAEPVSRLSDSLELEYAVTVERPAGAGEVILAVRVADEFDNQTVSKTKAP